MTVIRRARTILPLALLAGLALAQTATAQPPPPLGPSPQADNSVLRVSLHAPPGAELHLVLSIEGLPGCAIVGRMPADAGAGWVAGLARVPAVCAFGQSAVVGLDRAAASQVRWSGRVTVDGRTHVLEGGGGYPLADVYDADLQVSPKGEVAFTAAVG